MLPLKKTVAVAMGCFFFLFGFDMATNNYFGSMPKIGLDYGSSEHSCNPILSKLDKVGTSVMVTGGAGFIGMHTSLKLKDLGFQVVAIDNLNSYYSRQLKDDRLSLLKNAGVGFVEGDVCNETLLMETFRDFSVDRVIHLAAQAGVRYSLIAPHSYVRNNVDCHLSILETFHKQGLHSKPLVYASSSSVYGFNTETPKFSEKTSDVNHPASLYAATKRAGELMAYTYNHLHNISSVGLRFFTVYGPWGRPDMSPMIFADRIQNDGKTLFGQFVSVATIQLYF